MNVAKIKDLCNEAGQCFNQGDYDAGLELVDDALEQCRTNTHMPQYALVLCLSARGWLLHGKGERDKADQVFASMTEEAEEVDDSAYDYAVAAWTHAHDYYEETGRPEKATACWQQVLGLLQKHLGFDHPRYQMACARLRSRDGS